MRLANTSRWETDDVRALFAACAASLNFKFDRVRIEARTFRGGKRDAAAAYRNGTQLVLILKLAIPERWRANAVDAIATAQHEVAGALSGAALRPIAHCVEWLARFARSGSRGGLNADAPLPGWVAGMVLRPQAKPGPLTPDELAARRQVRAEKKLTQVRDKLTMWKRKLALAKTKVKTYTREVRRRERAVAGN